MVTDRATTVTAEEHPSKKYELKAANNVCQNNNKSNLLEH